MSMKKFFIIPVCLALIFSIIVFPASAPVKSADATNEAKIAQSFGDGASLSIREAYTHISYSTDLDPDMQPVGGRYDKSSVFSVGEIPSDTKVAHTSGMCYSAIDTSQTYVFEMSVFVSGSALAAINAMWDNTLDLSLLLKIDSDGNIWYNSNWKITKTDMVLPKGSWHKVRVSYDNVRMRYSLFVNDTQITDTTYIYGKTQAAKMWFGVDSSSYNGIVAYDDFRGYYGEYIPSEPSENVYVSEPHIFTGEQSHKLGIKSGANTGEDYTLILSSYKGSELVDVDIHRTNAPDDHFAKVLIDPDYNYKVFVWYGSEIIPITKPVSISNEELFCKTKIGDNVILNTGFEDSIPMDAQRAYGNIIEQRTDSDGNVVAYFERANTSDFHLSATGVEAINSDYVVYEFDFKVLDEMSVFNLSMKDEAGNVNTFASLSPQMKFLYADKQESVEADVWYNFAVVINTKDRVAEYYFDGEKKAGEYLNDSFAKDGIISLVRFHVTIYNKGETASVTDNVSFMIDNLKIYEGHIPKDEIGEERTDIRYNGRSIFPDDITERELLSGTYAIHSRSGVVYDGREKTLMKNSPYETEGKIIVNASELDSILSESSGLSGNVSIYDYANSIGREVLIEKELINSGLIVLSESGFSMPEDGEQSQKLNDFVFNLRPDLQEVTKAYNLSPTKGVHPRIQATSEDFERIKELYETDANVKKWTNTVVSRANSLVGAAPLKYELRDGVRLLSVSRDMLLRMYTLGMAYQLTGDQKYVEQAWVDLSAVCTDFPDWHPVHDLDLGEMAAAVSIGYDWMYDALSEQRRLAIEQGIYKNGLYDATWGFQSTNSPTGSYSLIPDNHNVVTNGGIAMLGLAFLDVYPEECAYVISNAVRAVDNMLYKFAPDGAWYEGPGYWEYTMQYTSKLISSLKSALGTDFGLSSGEGLSSSGEFMLYFQSSTGIYCYGDAMDMNIYPPEILWLAKEYNLPGIGEKLIEIIDGNFADSEATVIGLLWYTPYDDTVEYDLALDKMYSGENVITMRKNWDNDGSAFVGIHAGKTNISHSQLDGGSFIYDYGDIRWAKDLGMQGYNVLGYWDAAGDDGQRWTYFRSRAESHNTLVINPSSLSDHYTDSFAALELVSSDSHSAIVTVDMTELLHDVTSAKRGFFFTDNRSSLVIRDEISLTKESDIYWFMITDAEVTLTENGAVLSQNGQSINLDFITDADARISCDVAKPLPTSPDPEGNVEETSNRIAIKLTGNGNINLTVKLTPQEVEGTPVSNYHKPISEW